MAGRAKHKLVRLLEDLDVQDSADTFQDFVPDDGSQQDGGQTVDDEDDHTTTECSSSDEADDDSPGGHHSPKSRRPSSHSVPYERYHVMEKRAVTLLAENKGLQALHEHHVQATNLEVAELRGHLRMLVQAS